MWCSYCGKELIDGTKFCPECGTMQSVNELNRACVDYYYDSYTVQEKISFTDSVKSYFKNYANFKGRTSRREYWWCFLFSWLVGMVASFIPYLGMIIGLAFFIPGLALNVRRLHDIGKTGWNLLFAFIPLAGPIILLVFYCQKSDEANQWGMKPRM